ncbi:hypothetical protein ENC_44730 [Enterobacter hormaechei]|nr:hypothetical protein ENC_44730 [Enterobacter hormaechei]
MPVRLGRKNTGAERQIVKIHGGMLGQHADDTPLLLGQIMPLHYRAEVAHRRFTRLQQRDG